MGSEAFSGLLLAKRSTNAPNNHTLTAFLLLCFICVRHINPFPLYMHAAIIFSLPIALLQASPSWISHTTEHSCHDTTTNYQTSARRRSGAAQVMETIRASSEPVNTSWHKHTYARQEETPVMTDTRVSEMFHVTFLSSTRKAPIHKNIMTPSDPCLWRHQWVCLPPKW